MIGQKLVEDQMKEINKVKEECKRFMAVLTEDVKKAEE